METEQNYRYFISYTGVTLPLKLVNEIANEGLQNRITYFKGYYDERDRLIKLEKIVYGEIEFVHNYEYSNSDVLEKAILMEDDEDPRTLVFDENGQATET